MTKHCTARVKPSVGVGKGEGGVACVNAEEHSRSDVLNETKLGEERLVKLDCTKATGSLLGERNISFPTPFDTFGPEIK
ncbi:hypothetical protein J6590_000169 [Homalodisca vitripennis]|nr:hypothetical protein J6590_000169 [Homalodisca vitripennis]